MYLNLKNVLLMTALSSSFMSNISEASILEKINSKNSVKNAIDFHLIDFVGWNNKDDDVLRRYHSKDVKVYMGGQYTSGMDAHLNAIHAMFSSPYYARITRHSPTVVEGDWNCTVGHSDYLNFTMATVAKFNNGVVVEEYVLSKQLQPEDKISLKGNPLITIKNSSEEVKKAAGAELGWSCSLDQTTDGKWAAIFTKRDDQNEPVKELIFSE